MLTFISLCSLEGFKISEILRGKLLSLMKVDSEHSFSIMLFYDFYNSIILTQFTWFFPLLKNLMLFNQFLGKITEIARSFITN